jgi:hypothetical protein
MSPERATRVARLAHALGVTDTGDSWARTRQQAERHHRVRRAVIGLLVLCNLSLLLVLGRAGFARAGAVPVIAVTCLLPLVVDLGISSFLLRRWSAATPALVSACVLLEVFACLAWVQQTGSVSSYFIASLYFLPLVYRATYSAGICLLASLAMPVGLAAMYLLEARGALPYASLFADGLREPPPPGYRLTAFVAITSMVGVSALLAQLFVARWQRSLQMLADVEDRLREAEARAQLGRLSGTTLGAYRLGELLGRGGMGEVYLAVDQAGSEVAIKLLHAHMNERPEMRARFRRESDVLARLPASRVAAVLDVGVSPEGYEYIVMERLRGEDLAARLRRSEGMPLPEAIGLVAEVATALDAAHALGVVHRDLKPQNVFVCTQPRSDGSLDVRLLDFGVACLLESQAGLTATHNIVGTPGYFSPEQALGEEPGPAADVFSLGAIAYRLITGRAAFLAKHPAAAMREVLDVEPPPASRLVPGLPAEVDLVLAVALALRPEERFARAGELAAALARAARGEADPELARRAGQRMPRAQGAGGTLA